MSACTVGESEVRSGQGGEEQPLKLRGRIGGMECIPVSGTLI